MLSSKHVIHKVSYHLKPKKGIFLIAWADILEVEALALMVGILEG